MTVIDERKSLGAQSDELQKHVWIINVSTYSHTAGLYRLALDIASRGVLVTFLSSAQDIAYLEALNAHGDLPFNLISFDPSLRVPEKIRKFQDLMDFVDAEGEAFKPILRKLKAEKEAGLPGPTCIIYDLFCTWLQEARQALDLPMFSFFVCGATAARFSQMCPRTCTDGTFTTLADGSLSPFKGSVEIQGLPPLRYTDLALSFREIPAVDRRIGEAMAEANGVVVNSFEELEPSQCRALRDHLSKQGAELFLVGPISSVESFKDFAFVQNEARESDCLRWLDGRKQDSVLYICLGTIALWKEEQVNEVARALEASEQSFVWVLPSKQELGRALPAGFRERTSGRGLIVGWASQLQVLNHASVGGFLTHCGWNSMIESISVGVPMIAWPQVAEQHLNCRIFSELQVAVPLGNEVPPFSLIGHEELVRAVRVLMVEERGMVIRAKARELMVKARNATVAIDENLKRIVDRIPGTSI